MTLAHPMIQPAGWGPDDEPDQVCKNMPRGRSALYRIIWHTSLAAAMRPPALQHTRMVWSIQCGAQKHLVASATVKPIPGKEGYWLERRDYPPMRWPTCDAPMHMASVKVVKAWVVKRQSPTPGQLIQGLAESGVATPASLEPLLSRLLATAEKAFGSRSPLIRFKHDTAEITEIGLERLRLWRSSGLIGHIRRRNEVVKAVEMGTLKPRDALSEISSQGLRSQAEDFARQIDAACSKWSGMSRENALLEQNRLTHQPPKLNALPGWMDPEELLPDDHPLRDWRKRMEAELANEDPAWPILPEGDRAVRRLIWLQANYEEIEMECGTMFSSAMDAGTGKFSAVRYWLTGLVGTNDPGLNSQTNGPQTHRD